jgi:hypothetical protein
MTDKPDGKPVRTWLLGVGEFALVFLVFSGFGAAFSLSVDLNSSSTLTMAIGGSAGIAGSLAWAVLCANQRWRTHSNWMVAGAVAGALGHPVFAILGFIIEPAVAPVYAVPIVALLGFLFWGIVTVPVGILAAAVCRAVLAMLLPAARGRAADG